MNKKRIFLTALAMVLVCAMSIMGTVAYLTNTTDTVTNTFIAAGGGQLIDPDGEDNKTDTEDDGYIKLQEHGITVNDNGQYILNNTVVQTNEYKILPGMVVPKDPYITIKGKTATPAYLYVEMINKFGDGTVDVDSLQIDTVNWLKLDIAGRDVYVYTAGKEEEAAIVTSDINDPEKPLYIIKDNEFTINPELDPTTIAEAGETLEFMAYLAQASIGDETKPEAIFNTCFGSTVDTAPEEPETNE